jgi:hypothetical protein
MELYLFFVIRSIANKLVSGGEDVASALALKEPQGFDFKREVSDGFRVRERAEQRAENRVDAAEQNIQTLCEH